MKVTMRGILLLPVFCCIPTVHIKVCVYVCFLKWISLSVDSFEITHMLIMAFCSGFSQVFLWLSWPKMHDFSAAFFRIWVAIFKKMYIFVLFLPVNSLNWRLLQLHELVLRGLSQRCLLVNETFWCTPVRRRWIKEWFEDISECMLWWSHMTCLHQSLENLR